MVRSGAAIAPFGAAGIGTVTVTHGWGPVGKRVLSTAATIGSHAILDFLGYCKTKVVH